MNEEKAYQAVLKTLAEYVRCRMTVKRDKSGRDQLDPDRRLEEIARLVVGAVLNLSDTRERRHVEACALQSGDVFTRYEIVETTDKSGKKSAVSVDEEVTVLRTERPTLINQLEGTRDRVSVFFRSNNGTYGEVEYERTWLVSVYRPTLADLREEFGDALRD